MPEEPNLTRPLMRYHGGKWRLAPWIIGQMPRHRTYVEPFGGAASVLLRKPRCYSEVYNDMNGDVVNLFRVLRSDRAADLVEAVRLTPFARDEFHLAYEACEDPLESARRLVARSYMGFGSGLSINRQSTGFRSDSKKTGSTPSKDWQSFPEALANIAERMRGVVIENRPAVEVLMKHDAPDALHYIDPPYPHSTRSQKLSSGARHHRYAFEMDDGAHEELLDTILRLRGRVMLSGYPHGAYDRKLADWRRVERLARADGGRARTEVLWLNFSEEAAAGPLFGLQGQIGALHA